MDAIIERIYEESNFPGLATLTKLVQQKNPSITKAYIKKWHATQLDVQLLHEQQKKQPSGHVVAWGKNERWNIDIYDLSKYASENGKMRYIFAVVDVFTRKAYAEPMMMKDGASCAGALQSIIMEHKIKPKLIISDSDAAYFSKDFQAVLNENKIILDAVVVGDHHAMGIIDNFAKRLKLIFSKMYIKNKNHKWLNRLQSVITIYNNSAHSSISGLSPNKAQSDENHELISKLNLEKSSYNRTVSDLKPGDKVRKLDTHIFKKGTEPKWSEETFEVKKVMGNSIELTDGTKHKRQNLLNIPSEA